MNFSMTVSAEGVLHKKRTTAALSPELGYSHISGQHESDIWVPGLGRLFFTNKKNLEYL